MNTPETLLAFRQAALRANLRTIACTFDGSGDEGHITEIGLPVDDDGLLRAHDGISDSCTCQSHLDEYDKVSKTWSIVPEVQALRSLAIAHEISLEQLFYDVLDHFPGDWVNNSGGYGSAYLDLATGAYYIDGAERYESSEDAIAKGSHFPDALAVVNPADDTAAYIKNLLQ